MVDTPAKQRISAALRHWPKTSAQSRGAISGQRLSVSFLVICQMSMKRLGPVVQQARAGSRSNVPPAPSFEMSRKLFVGNLPIRSRLSVCQKPLSVRHRYFFKVIVDRETGRSRGFAFSKWETDDQRCVGHAGHERRVAGWLLDRAGAKRRAPARRRWRAAVEGAVAVAGRWTAVRRSAPALSGGGGGGYSGGGGGGGYRGGGDRGGGGGGGYAGGGGG